MLPNFLVPEIVARQNGVSPEMELGSSSSKFLLLTLGINETIELESLDVSVWGSSDRVTWGLKPLACFPQKSYCGTYAVLLDLSVHPGIRFLRAEWKMNRWGYRDRTPLFGFCVLAQETQNTRSVAVA